MCGRYTLTYEEQRELEEFLGVEEESFFPGQPSPTAFANFNVAPSHNMPVACTDGDANRIVTPMYWGFMGWKPKPGSRPFLPINTRDDSVAVDRKSTRLNSSHVAISYAVFCLKNKITEYIRVE